MATNEAKISFSMGGYSFNSDDVTHILEIEPTAVTNGNTQLGDNRPAISSWELSTKTFVDDDIDIFSMTGDLIKEIEPSKDKILLAIENYNLVPKIVVKLTLSADKDEPVPEIGFGSRTVKFLASIGAYIDIETKKH